MSKILKIKDVDDYCGYVGYVSPHPLVCVIDYAEVSPICHSLNNYGVYGIFFHDEADIDLAYGCGKYDYKKGTVICVAPGQVGGKEDNGERVALTGWALLFHPDLLHGTPLEKSIKNYTFFDYRVNEALHMTDEEHDVLALLMRQIREELQKKHDGLQDDIIVGYIELVLNYCLRFYNRQFVTRKLENSNILARFAASSAPSPALYIASNKIGTETMTLALYSFKLSAICLIPSQNAIEEPLDNGYKNPVVHSNV